MKRWLRQMHLQMGSTGSPEQLLVLKAKLMGNFRMLEVEKERFVEDGREAIPEYVQRLARK